MFCTKTPTLKSRKGSEKESNSPSYKQQRLEEGRKKRKDAKGQTFRKPLLLLGSSTLRGVQKETEGECADALWSVAKEFRRGVWMKNHQRKRAAGSVVSEEYGENVRSGVRMENKDSDRVRYRETNSALLGPTRGRPVSGR